MPQRLATMRRSSRIGHSSGAGVLAFVALAGAFEGHAAGVVADLTDGFDFFRLSGIAPAGRRGRRACSQCCAHLHRASWMSVGTTLFTALLPSVHRQASWSMVRPYASRRWGGLFRVFRRRARSSRRGGGAVVAIAEFVAGIDVIVEQAAVIDHAGQDIDAVLFRRGKHVLAGPGLEGIQNDHRPVHAVAESAQSTRSCRA
jgi:hypothetical protein